MQKNKPNKKLSLPVFKTDQFSQIWFTVKKVSELLWQINPRLTLTIFVLSAIWGLLTFPAFYLEKLILDRIVANIGRSDWQETIYPIIFLITGRILIETARRTLSRLSSFFGYHASRLFSARMDVMMADKFSNLDARTIEDPDFQDRFNKVERESGRRAWGLIMPLTNLPNYVTGFISAVAVLWFLNPVIAFGVVVVSVPLVWVDRGYIKKDYEYSEEISPLYRIWGWLHHTLTATRSYLELRILQLQNYLTRRMESLQDQILSGSLELKRRKEKARILADFPATVFYMVVNVYLVILALSQKITVGSYELFLRSLLAAQQNFSGLASSFLEIYENYIFVADLVWFLDLEPRLDMNKKGTKIKKIEHGIAFHDVAFKYQQDGAWVLKDVDVEFRVGDKVAIVGENGAGKSTLIKLLARFYDPDQGQISVDGVDIRDLDYVDYQKKFAILFQDFEAYPYSVKETIGYGDVERLGDLASIKKAARQTEIEDYIQSLPLKYQNPLNPQFPKGVEPSAGQWQRFGIARMLFRKNAEILILDEPTSNVDPEAEEKIFKQLIEKATGKTSKVKILIFVSQRFSTVRRADRILVVDDGKIIEQGRHDELMAKTGKYARLFNLQAKGYR